MRETKWTRIWYPGHMPDPWWGIAIFLVAGLIAAPIVYFWILP